MGLVGIVIYTASLLVGQILNSEGHQAEAGEHLLGQGRPDQGPHQVLSQDQHQ